MVKADLVRLAVEPPIEEQLDLAQTLWEHTSPTADFTVTPELEELLKTRLKPILERGIPWEDMKARLLKRA